ncbi:hypothetical protein BVV10_14350 [Xanthomonas oryzae pv. oryzae]|nr:hypothetical protein BVV16_14340 [Xanthomonas oryzae pv. oryzae]AUI94748.1 hypothetical protein BVV17_14345 [Xanthomonas oryzae pv. oryzae]AUI98420.1 hypothetical protein BVV18_14350 [Xanthomonas oryzae pv. oryzae]AUJ02096.1 hypothetical protein BVV10_14350 [Xanthomonas oryzae pv. oryzae]AUJ05768.1 hypothetical protein BVV19_14375 [Xanthomonas oryzae pv. oryzae]
MGENCQKPGRSVTKTGNSSTPETQVKPCNGCGLGVFQGRLLRMGGRRVQTMTELERQQLVRRNDGTTRSAQWVL